MEKSNKTVTYYVVLKWEDDNLNYWSQELKIQTEDYSEVIEYSKKFIKDYNSKYGEVHGPVEITSIYKEEITIIL